MKQIISVVIVYCFFAFPCKAQIKDAIAKQVGDSIQTSLGEGRTDFMEQNFNTRRFLSFFQVSNPSNLFLTEINEGMEKSNLVKSFCENLIKDPSLSYNFVSFSEDENGNYYLLFRMFSDAGIGYHEYFLEFESMDNYYLSDIFLYHTGEYFSQTMARLYLPRIREKAKKELAQEEWMEKLKDEPIVTNEDLDKSTKVRKLLEQNNKPLAKIIYKTISEEAKTSMYMLLLALELIDDEDEKGYAKIIDQIVTKGKGKTSAYLYGIDKFFLEKKYDKSIEMIDSLYTHCNDDFLNYYKANIYAAAENWDSAEVNYKYIIQNYPNAEHGYNGLIEIYYKQEKYDSCIGYLAKMNEFVELDLKETNKSIQTDYVKVYEHPNYKKWFASVKRRKK